MIALKPTYAELRKESTSFKRDYEERARELQNFTMVRNGTCEKCDTCSATSGCS